MKKILLLFAVALFCFQGAKADMTVLNETFKCLQDDNRASGQDMGARNMTFEAMGDKWMGDADGKITTALLVVYVENMSDEDMKDLNIKLSNGEIPQMKDNKVVYDGDGLPTRWFFIPIPQTDAKSKKKTKGKANQQESASFDIDFTHKKAGHDRLFVSKMEVGNTYFVRLRVAGITPIIIESTPPGADIYLDDERLSQQTNATIPDVAYGEHTLRLEFPLGSAGNSLPKQTITVSPGATKFSYDLMKTKEITIVPNPNDANLVLFNDKNQPVAKSEKGNLKVNLSYGTYKLVGFLNNGEKVESQLIINETTASEKEVKIIPSKSMTFRALQNNQEVTADINIDGESYGTTPLNQDLQYGSYNVDMSYNGFSRSKRIKVSKNSDREVIFKLPNSRKVAWNPFDVDYQPYDIGVGLSYINRCYRWTEKGFSNSYTDFFGQSRRNHGAEINLLYQRLYKYGQGFRTGLNTMLTFGEIDVDGESETYGDITLQIPLEYQFRLPLSQHFSIFAHGGIGLNIGILSRIDINEDEKINIGYGYNSEFDMILPKRFDCTWIIGGGIQFKRFQLEAKFERGLYNNAKLLKKYWGEDISGVTWRRQTWSVGLIYLFKSDN